MLTEFAERFERLRQDRGYTQQKIAEKLGVTPQAVSKWENGTSLPDAEMIRFIAQLLDCTTDYLLNHQASGISQYDQESVQRKTMLENVIQMDVLKLKFGTGLVDMLIEENSNHCQKFHDMRMRLGYEMGIIVPLIRLMDDITLGEKEYQILINGRKIVAQNESEYPKYFYLREELLPVAEWRTVWPDGKWMEKQVIPPEGCVEYSAMDCIVTHLAEVILCHYDQILNRQLTADLVDMVRRRYPAAVNGVVPERVPLSLLQHVLAGLVTSRTPINQLDYIIGYLEEHPVSGPEGIEAAVAALSRELH